MTGSNVRVLAYHRVLPRGLGSGANPSVVSAWRDDFERQMRHLAARYRAVTMEQVLAAARGEGRLPGRAVLITFDDAYTDFAEFAWPVMRRLGLPATLFVPTAYPGDGRRAFWWDRVHAAIQSAAVDELDVAWLGRLRLRTPEQRLESLRRVQAQIKGTRHTQAMAMVDALCEMLGAGDPAPAPVLGWDELRALDRDGVTLAPHTRTHPSLPQMDPDAARREIEGSLEDLLREVGRAPNAIAYPFGLHDDHTVDAARDARMALGFTCLDGHNALPSPDPLRLRRTVITTRTTPTIFAARLHRAISRIDAWRHGGWKRGRVGARRRAPAREAEAGGGPRPAVTALPLPLIRSAAPTRRSAPVHTARPKIGYIMSRFPKLSETFVLNEILTAESLGIDVEIFPLLRERQPVAHPEVSRLMRRVRFQPFVSPGVVRANAHYFLRSPRVYLAAWAEAIHGTARSPRFLAGAIAYFPKAARFAFEAEQVGVTHIHAHFCTHPALGALIIHRLSGIPFSFTAHGSDLHVDRTMLARKVEAAAFAITISDYNRGVMIGECGERCARRIHVIRCGVDPEYFIPAQRRTDDVFRIVCVASLEPVKGHRYLLEACRILIERGREFRCELVGDGPLRSELEEQLRAERLGGRVRIHGGQPRQVVSALLSGADVAVLASHPTPDGRREGIPVALMEAMASGLPVIASRLSGIPELVRDGETGILVESGNPVAIADAIERLMDDPELRREMGRAGRAWVLREHDLRTNTIALLRLILGSAGSSAVGGIPLERLSIAPEPAR